MISSKSPLFRASSSGGPRERERVPAELNVRLPQWEEGRGGGGGGTEDKTNNASAPVPRGIAVTDASRG